MTSYKTLEQAESIVGSLAGKRVLLRADLNVPIVNGDVRDDFRIQKLLPTLRFLAKAGAKTIVLAHLESVETVSLKTVAAYVAKQANAAGICGPAGETSAVSFAGSLAELSTTVASMESGDIAVLENLRAIDLFGAGEKKNSPELAKTLAVFGDLYVNEAFSVSHRPHASIVGLPKLLPHFAGPLFHQEISRLSAAFAPAHPFVFMLGGAKFETKMPLVNKFLEKADTVFVGGALSNDIFKARGLEVGASVCAPKQLDLSAISASPKLLVPTDVLVNDPNSPAKPAAKVLASERILDAGPETVKLLSGKLVGAKFVLWNGPLGDYEKGFEQATIDLAKAVLACPAQAVLGGGDTIAVLDKAGLLEACLKSDRIFVSTGGGAMLDFLANETLVGLEALA